ncbi:MAG: hypothetical protein CO093_01995 [Alphaproteobacteria bacterium CG_4_9_14_3_um_filter_47_13]|nr:MAG: hypothetical protein CO093_01995 [Alphaproteobacteria bacterium CG_4_9_14_3_um_filter_47_13]
MTKNAPDFIWGKGALQKVCAEIFSYPADLYDLGAYKKCLPWSAQRIWNLVQQKAKDQGIIFSDPH